MSLIVKFDNNNKEIIPMGGTELMKNRLLNSVDPIYWDKINLLVSNIPENLDSLKKNLLWIHDCADDPRYKNTLLNKEIIDKIDVFVFVSHWQLNEFMKLYKIPWNKCFVIKNAIEPIEEIPKEKSKKLKFIYTSTPHRGLDVLYKAIQILSKERDDFEVDIFSSFNLYGWSSAQEKYEEYFHEMSLHPNINYYGTKSNEEVRKALQKAHIFIYPTTYLETYCLCMVEALSAKCLSITSNIGALPEISGNFAFHYVWEPNKDFHAQKVASLMKFAIDNYWTQSIQSILSAQKLYIDGMHDWKNRKNEWEMLLKSII